MLSFDVTRVAIAQLASALFTFSAIKIGARGLVERADFLERLLADLYGKRRLIAEGTLPGPILGQNPEFLRPVADQGLSGEPLIRFIAMDLGRGPDGRWWVLGDRTQAPSGASCG